MSENPSAVGIAATSRNVYVLRSDGAVFVLFQRGELLPDGSPAAQPCWLHGPAVPGTDAAEEQEG